MNWITTNIRFPEDMYDELRMEAAKNRTSIASVVRGKISEKSKAASKNNTDKLLTEMDRIAREISKQNPGVSLSEKLIEMRYEQ